ncbi:MAG: zinc-binding dehydrogenase [Saprospiraceae bacterium]|nr:zinc-binding dehydrogenase [Saprospiraceae bacterium]
MDGLVYRGVKASLELAKLDRPKIRDGEVLMTMQAAALNHRDVWIAKGLYPNLREGIVLGSDGVGTADGGVYIINPNQEWGLQEAYSGPGYTILGMPNHGTFATYLAVPRHRIVEKPSHISTEEAAALPLAGLTAYRALFKKCQLSANEKVLITGIGGGVALFACQFALAKGAQVWVTSGSAQKIDQAKLLGASGGAIYKETDWDRDLKKNIGGFDVIIDGAAGPGFAKLISLARPGARIALYGGTAGEIKQVSPQKIFWKQLQILGSTMGSDKDFSEMVAFVSEYKIRPVIDATFTLSSWQSAFERMDRSEQFGKIVLTLD